MRTAMNARLVMLAVYLVLVVAQCAARADDAAAAIEKSNAAFEQGNAALAKGDLDAAVTAYAEAIKLKPDYAAAFYQRGLVWAKKGEWDKSLADFNAAIQFKNDNADAYYQRAAAFGAMNEWDNAINNCNALAPRNTVPLPSSATSFTSTTANCSKVTGRVEIFSRTTTFILIRERTAWKIYSRAAGRNGARMVTTFIPSSGILASRRRISKRSISKPIPPRCHSGFFPSTSVSWDHGRTKPIKVRKWGSHASGGCFSASRRKIVTPLFSFSFRSCGTNVQARRPNGHARRARSRFQLRVWAKRRGRKGSRKGRKENSPPRFFAPTSASSALKTFRRID